MTWGGDELGGTRPQASAVAPPHPLAVSSVAFLRCGLCDEPLTGSHTNALRRSARTRPPSALRATSPEGGRMPPDRF